MSDSVLARVAALKTTSTPALKAKWRDLFETEPPPYNRRFLESRLAYRMHSGTRLWRPEARDDQAAGSDRGGPGRRRPGAPVAACQGSADFRHAAHPRVSGGRALRDRARRGLRVPGPSL
jgi:Protein of unknown function (DUF2924)